ncbi:hypothetical protein F3Y22_tig00111137pilonHSYRG00003 [Hibiscus syriacus]|uniref:Uncharacterized protein n=1 Tax=Hibiscus syriacus TaxID=106335 RepID=A0A6A2YXM0_HIBSY|nr:hypothetical protein F3Y22_tig00111137pilonHSYRG00003 [Hibiscus syriacus]
MDEPNVKGIDDSNSAPELSQSGISFEESNLVNGSKGSSMMRKRRKTPNDSEDDGAEGIKLMKGLENLGMGVGSKRKVRAVGFLESVQQENGSFCGPNTSNCLANVGPNNGSRNHSSSLKRKRSQVANVNEILKRKNRRRPLTKVLESTAMMSVPVACDELPSSSTSPTDSKNLLLMLLKLIIRQDSEISSIPELAGNESSDRLFYVPFLGEDKPSADFSPIFASCSSETPEVGDMGRQAEVGGHNESGFTRSVDVRTTSINQKIEKGAAEWQLKGKRKSRQISEKQKQDPRKYADMVDEPNAYVAGLEILAASCERVNEAKVLPDGSVNPQRSLPYRQSRYTVNPRYQTTDFPGKTYSAESSLYENKIDVKADYQPQHVPLVSLMSKLNGKAVRGHPLPVEALNDDYYDNPTQEAAMIQRLSSLTGQKLGVAGRKLVAENPIGPVIACIPLKLVFSRINEVLKGSARPSDRS